MPDNPYQAPVVTESFEDNDVLPAATRKRIADVVRNARLAMIAGLMPLLGVFFVLPLLQWYVLRNRYPILAEGDAGEHAELVAKFHGAKRRLWFGTMIWPVIVLVACICFGHLGPLLGIDLGFIAIVCLLATIANSPRLQRWAVLLVVVPVGLLMMLLAPVRLAANFAQGRPFEPVLALLTAADVWLVFVLLRSFVRVRRMKRNVAQAESQNPMNEA